MWEGTGIGSQSVYWILEIFVLITLLYSGYGISYGKKEDFKTYALLGGTVYSLVEGLRWMRGADYYHYYNDLVTLFGQYPGAYGRGTITPDPEPIYDFWVTSFHLSGLPFWVAFIFYSAILISGLLLIVKLYPKTAIWTLPLFFIITVSSTENLIRQYFALSFILFAFYFFLKGTKTKMLLMLIIAPLIHYSSLIVEIPFLFFAYVKSEKILNFVTAKNLVWVLVVLFVYFYWLFDISYFSFVSDFLTSHISTDSDDKMSVYTENADRWFTEEGSISQVVSGKAAGAIGMVAQFARFFSYLAIVYYGFIIIRDNQNLALLYYLTYAAIFFKVATGDIEIYIRFYTLFGILLPFMIGLIMTSPKIKNDLKVILGVIFAINFLWYGFITSTLQNAMFGFGFIWDSTVPLL